MPQFQIGDRVRLKSGGAVMVVYGISDGGGGVHVHWTEAGSLVWGTIHAKAVVLVREAAWEPYPLDDDAGDYRGSD